MSKGTRVPAATMTLIAAAAAFACHYKTLGVPGGSEFISLHKDHWFLPACVLLELGGQAFRSRQVRSTRPRSLWSGQQGAWTSAIVSITWPGVGRGSSALCVVSILWRLLCAFLGPLYLLQLHKNATRCLDFFFFFPLTWHNNFRSVLTKHLKLLLFKCLFIRILR